MNKKQKKVLYRIIIASVLLAVLQLLLHFVEIPVLVQFVLYMVPYIVIGGDILKKAFHGITHKQVFDECFLMTVATVGAIILGLVTAGEEGGFLEGVAVMLFYQIGELFQSVAVGKSRKNITDLMDIRPDYANIYDENGELVQADPDEIEIGTIIVVKAGEKIPIDGIVREGSASLDTSALTGESLPVQKDPGDEVISGCVNLTGLLKIETTREFGESTVSKILDMVENSSMKKSKSENFISKFARYYTPIVCVAALILAIIPPLVIMFTGGVGTGHHALWHVWKDWILRACTFLVISCPCAVVISIPLSFFAGLGGASNQGILIKGSNYLETLSQVKTIAFDKTGTITKGNFAVTTVHKSPIDEKKLLEYAAHAEAHSSHPIARSVREAYGKYVDMNRVTDLEEISGHGIVAKVDGVSVAIGNDKLMHKLGIEHEDCDHVGTILHVALDGVYSGHIVIADEIKENSKEAMAALKAAGVEKLVMLTGDAENVAKSVASEVGLTDYRAQLLPADKVSCVEELLKECTGNKRLAFVGDGINDAPVLSRADIGIAMGALGSDAAIEAADVVLMDDDPKKIAKAIKISRKCINIVKQNIVFALGVKVVCLVLAALGIANMWVAIIADVGVMILAVLNAIRCLFVKNL